LAEPALPGRLCGGTGPVVAGARRQHRLLHSYRAVLRLAVRPPGTRPGVAAAALVFRHRRGNGSSDHHSQLEPRLAALVLAFLAVRLASVLLAGPARRPPRAADGVGRTLQPRKIVSQWYCSASSDGSAARSAGSRISRSASVVRHTK